MPQLVFWMTCVFSIVTLLARTLIVPVTCLPLMTAPAWVTVSEPLGVSVTPAGTPVLVGSGKPQALGAAKQWLVWLPVGGASTGSASSTGGASSAGGGVTTGGAFSAGGVFTGGGVLLPPPVEPPLCAPPEPFDPAEPVEPLDPAEPVEPLDPVEPEPALPPPLPEVESPEVALPLPVPPATDVNFL